MYLGLREWLWEWAPPEATAFRVTAPPQACRKEQPQHVPGPHPHSAGDELLIIEAKEGLDRRRGGGRDPGGK